VLLTSFTQRIEDEDIRVRWFRSPDGAMLARLVGPLAVPSAAPREGAGGLAPTEVRTLQLLIEGRDNREVATELGLTESEVAASLVALYAKIGAASRVDATAIALGKGLT